MAAPLRKSMHKSKRREIAPKPTSSSSKTSTITWLSSRPVSPRSIPPTNWAGDAWRTPATTTTSPELMTLQDLQSMRVVRKLLAYLDASPADGAAVLDSLEIFLDQLHDARAPV
jgi:hypothetical protein